MLATLALATALRPYPIPPVSLMEHCLEADLIVVGRPGPTVPVEDPGRPTRFVHEVVLAVERTIAGPTVGEVTVRYRPRLICPAPARYPEGTAVLTFLVRDDEGRYRPNGLSYGTKFPSPSGLEAYAARIVEMRELQARFPVMWSTSEEMVEWALRCLEHPETRGDGLTALRGGYLGGWRDEGPPSLEDRLDVHRSLRVLDVFRASDPLRPRDDSLLDLLRDWRDPRVNAAILEAIEDQDRTPVAWAPTLIETWAERNADGEVERLLDGWRAVRQLESSNPGFSQAALLRAAFLAHVNGSDGTR